MPRPLAPCLRPSPPLLPELELDLGAITLCGASLAARATAFTIPELDVILDLGRLVPTTAERSTVLLTHGHLDHLSGILAYLNLRARFHQGETTRLWGPGPVIGPLRQALAVMPGMESVRKRMRLEDVLREVRPGETVALPHGTARAFAVEHGVPGVGWALCRAGEPRPLLVYGGDGATTPYEASPELLDAGAALVECTFPEPNRRVVARLSGHAHMLDWLDLAPRLRCDTLILMHLPALPWAELEVLAAPLAEAFPGRLVLWADCHSQPTA
jgi:ribonuclease BN (tRNA processing enzyme)